MLCCHSHFSIALPAVGLGKTRVIVHMLVLELASRKRLVRLNFLSQLVSEVYDFLHEHLTGGLLATKLFVFPFHRDVGVSPQAADVLLAQAALCASDGGAALMAPVARCSLHLKQHELRLAADGGRGAEADALARFEALPWANGVQCVL